ncbi:hypothetical protein DNTS_001688 [Danionella cerebrum]|uniref:Immunoglobulin subtype domain-containing protein n=1 Tax=Danionella cerebrum TaxID=2873325 RepID=A0A553QJ58_9TELE|nr:hypothetical protein DNTS_001688 [Danionella translucida]
MLLRVWPVLSAVLFGVLGSAIAAIPKRITHGHMLTLDLPERTEKLQFVSADESDQYTIWEHKALSLWPSKPSKGQVTSANDGWTFRLKQVTFEDAGTYILRNHFGSTVSSYTVTVLPNKEVIERIAGETLYISLAGLKQTDATLSFYGNYSKITLVEDGVPVGNSHPDYISRLKVNRDWIQILHVNVSDLGRYVLTDQKGRYVSNSTMILVDQHSYSSNTGLIGLLALGLPCGICFCCRKRICKGCQKKKSYSTPVQTPDSNPIPMTAPCSVPVTDPGAPGQGYVAGYPANPDLGPIHHPPPQWSGQPAVPPNDGYQPGMNPPNPVYAPESAPGGPPLQPPPWNAAPPQYNPSGPVGYYPGNVPPNPVYPPEAGPPQPPQWNPPPTQYNPSAAVNYTPTVNSTPGQNDMPPTAPLLAPQPQSHQSYMGGVSMDVLNSTDSSIQFDINKGKSSGNNFL